MTKHDAVVLVLDEMPDAPAADIAEAVSDRFGIDVSGHYVRTVRSREGRSGTPVVPVQRSRRNHARTALPHAARSAQFVPRPVLSAVPMPARTTPRVRLAELAPPEQAAEDDGEAEVFRKIDRVLAAVEQALDGNPQKMDASPAAIAEVVSILSDPQLQEDFPGFEYEVFPLSGGPDGRQRLVIWQAGNPPAVMLPAAGSVVNGYVPPVPERPRVRQKRKRNRIAKCDFCTGKPAVPSANIYKVRSPVIGRMVYLCFIHAQAESVIPGTVIEPYRLYGGEQVNGAGVVRQPEIPYVKMLADLAKSVGDVVFGSGEPDSRA